MAGMCGISELNGEHPVLHTPMNGPWPEPNETIYFALGCFWGAERIFWQQNGVINTAVGYLGGTLENPTYPLVCTGTTGHAETVRVVYDPGRTSAAALLKVFWEMHDPTQGNRQGNDIGSQYRSLICTTTDEQAQLAEWTRNEFAKTLNAAGAGAITTEICDIATAGQFWPAEEYHQAYLYKNPNGYCMHGWNGYTCSLPPNI
ncbi:MAG: peptide-methionine (S)-S-oxide reductase MsrA [Varibaculum sp.]|nr:peptide-methionine (S)-S-oxide reductase MsrA [Varibaculum sp.]